MQAIYDRAKRIRVAAFDVDGVLTDGALHYADSGEESKRFSVHDGHGLRMLQASGVALAIITSRVSRCVEARARNLGIEWLFQGAADKLAAFRELLARSGAAPETCAFVGDDLVDLPVMRRCGLAATVAGAPMPLRRHAHWISRNRGGEGAVREFAEVVLYAQGALGARVAEHADR